MTVKLRTSQDRVNEAIVDRWRAGDTIACLAADYDVTWSVVTDLVLRSMIPKKRKKGSRR